MSPIKFKIRLILLLWGTFLLCTVVSAQSLKLDSLERTFKKYTTEDTVKVNILNNLAFTLYSQNPKKARIYAEESSVISNKINDLKGKGDSLLGIGLTYIQSDKKVALDYLQKALAASEKAGDKIGICNCFIHIGNISWALGDTKKSDESYKKALQIAKDIKDKPLIIRILYNTSISLSRKGKYPEAINQLHKVIRIAEEIGHKQTLSYAYGQLGYIYKRQGNYPVALEYYLSALKINEEMQNKTGVFYNLINISSIQSELKDYDAALKTIQKAFQISQEIGKPLLISTSYIYFGNIYLHTNKHAALAYFQKALAVIKDNNVAQRITILTNIGSIYTDQHKFNEAQKNFKEALTLAHKIGLKRICSEIWNKIGKFFFIQKKYSQAIEYTQKALQLAEELKLLEEQKESQKLLSEINAAKGYFEQAYTNQIKYNLLNDSIFNEKNVRKTALLESSYEYAKEKQKHEIEKMSHEMKLKNQRQIIFFLIVVSILILMLTFSVYRSGKLKKKLLKLEIENINHELEINQKAMTTATLKLVQNSERDANCVKILESIKKNTLEEGQNEIRSLLTDYKFNSHNSNWDEFEVLFQKVNSSFYDKLNECYPTLTPNERKLCIFLKLNMSNKHISQITFQSEEALKKARLRLRKKLELDHDTNLTAFIQSL